jgi:potassium uptake TrkH family protein
LTALVVEFGFPPGPHVRVLRGVELGVVVVFVADLLVRLSAARDRRSHLKGHWLEIVLLAALGAEVAWSASGAQGKFLAGASSVAVQTYLLARVALGLVRAHERLTGARIRPAWVLAGGFLLLIAAGSGLLLLPNCRAPGARAWSVPDAVFTATSAACVTGLGVRDVGRDLSFQGQLVVFGLIQVGGLGLVTIAMFLSFVNRRAFSLRQTLAMQEMGGTPAPGETGRFLGYTLAVTLGAELAGAALLYAARGDSGEDPGPRLWWAAFHSVSAFCNAGFSLEPRGLLGYAGSAPVCLTLAGLVLVGGLGFPVLLDLLRFQLSTLPVVRRWRWALRFREGEGAPASRLGLHTKLVLLTSAVLLLAGTGLFYAAEAEHALAGRPPGEAALASFFHAVMPRTAGFNTLDVASFRLPTLLLVMVLMAVGASPLSCGGGMKTSTVAVLGLTLRSMLRNRETVEAFGRAVPRVAVNAAVAVVILYGLAALVLVSVLAATQEKVGFVPLLFESVSALSTVGLSMGATTRLDEFGRGVLCVAMFVGRLGPLAILWTVLSRPSALRYQYPEESVIVS